MRKPTAILLSFFATLALAEDAMALFCTASISTPIDFGTVDILAGGGETTEGLLTVTCDVSLLDIPSLALGVAVCPGFGTGSAGATGSGRLLLRDGGTETLYYQLFSDAAGQNPWGGYSGGLLFGDAPLFRISASIGEVSGSWPIYGRVMAGQSTSPPGTYRSHFSGSGATGTEIRYGSLGNLLGCSALGALLQTSADFTVEATVEKNCLVTTDDVDFGTHGVLSADVPAEGAINLTCTSGTQFGVALETGLLPSSAREMKNGPNAVTYALFQNSQHTQLWGAASGEIFSGLGSGVEASIPVFGLVQPQATPPPGTYRDTVVVTVTY